MGGRDHSCDECGRGGFNDPHGWCICVVIAGQRVRARNASGEWVDMVAVSGVEGCYEDRPPGTVGRPRIIHDFVGVYLRRPDAPDDGGGMFWPLEDVEPAYSEIELEHESLAAWESEPIDG